MGAEFSAFFSPSGSSGVAIGTTPVTGGTTGRLLWDNAGTIGETTGWTTDGANAITGGASTTLAIGGATIGANAVAVTGTVAVSGNITSSAGSITAGVSVSASANLVGSGNTSKIVLGAAQDTILCRPAAATWQFGNLDAAAPVAQKITFQSVVAGTSNGNAVNTTFVAPLPTGSGTAGDFVFQTSGTGAGAAVQNSAVTALTIKGGTQTVVIASGKALQLGNTYVATPATCTGTVVIKDAAGNDMRVLVASP